MQSSAVRSEVLVHTIAPLVLALVLAVPARDVAAQGAQMQQVAPGGAPLPQFVFRVPVEVSNLHPDITAVSVGCCVGAQGTFCTPVGRSVDLPISAATRTAKGIMEVAGTPTLDSLSKLNYYACNLYYRTKQGVQKAFSPAYPTDLDKGVSGKLKVEGKLSP